MRRGSSSLLLFTTVFCGNSSVGRAQPCQGWGREFESRFPLTGRSNGGMVDTKDLKSFGQKWPCEFESRFEHNNSAKLSFRKFRAFSVALRLGRSLRTARSLQAVRTPRTLRSVRPTRATRGPQSGTRGAGPQGHSRPSRPAGCPSCQGWRH